MTAKSKWAQFYESRVNSERYDNHFKTRYAPFLQAIKDEDPNRIADVGCGIGSVSKVLQPLGMDCLLIDNDPEMLSLARLNNNQWIKPLDIIRGDIVKTSHVIQDRLCITHGVLEHFNNMDIWKAIESMPYSIHYVPLIGHGAPSFGDERLFEKEWWIYFLGPLKWGTFNEGKDLWFLIKRD